MSQVDVVVIARCLLGEDIADTRWICRLVGMVGSCPYLDASTIYSARDMKRRGTGPTVAPGQVRHNNVQAHVEAAVTNVQGGKQTSDTAQDIGLIWFGHMIYCGLGMCVLNGLWM